jgi:hypothetical protein
MKMFWWFQKIFHGELKIELSYNLATLPLVISLKEWKAETGTIFVHLCS